MIEIKNLSIAYGGESVLENVYISIAKGEKVALMGPSGCGKTSLLRTAAGLLEPASGSVEISGRISCVFQEPRLLPWLTARENVNLVLSDSPATIAEADKWLAAVGLAEAADKLPAELSGGMQQRLSIARALAYGGDILLLDEPLKGMDAALREDIAALIRREAQGRTVLLITHHEDEAKALADRVYVYRDKKFFQI